MTSPFELVSPRRVIIGRGRLADIGVTIQTMGNRCVLFTGGNPDRAKTLIDRLQHAGMEVMVMSHHGEPSFHHIRHVVEAARSFAPQVAVAMGGGSVIDTAKAVAMLLTNGGDPLDYAEVIGRGLPILKASLPLVVIPTTAGAGTEATRNAVLIDRERNAKVSLRSHLMLPDLVVIDPELTRGLPASITAATGMDALAQLIEAFVSVKANPVTDALCRAGIPRAARSLRIACREPDNLDAREDMALAAWWSGVALANAGLGAVHGFAAALGGMSHAPHGLVCAVMLAPVCHANIAAMQRSSSSSPALEKYAEAARLLTNHPAATPEDGVAWLTELTTQLPLAKLSTFGIAKLPQLAVIDAAQRSSSMKGNPVALTNEELADILAAVTR